MHMHVHEFCQKASVLYAVIGALDIQGHHNSFLPIHKGGARSLDKVPQRQLRALHPPETILGRSSVCC